MKFTEIKKSFLTEQIYQYSNFTRAPYSLNTFHTGADSRPEWALQSPVHLIYTSDPHGTSCAGRRLGEPRKMLKVQLNVDEQPVEPQFLSILRHLRCIHILFPIRCLGSRASTGVQKVSRLVGKDSWGF